MHEDPFTKIWFVTLTKYGEYVIKLKLKVIFLQPNYNFIQFFFSKIVNVATSACCMFHIKVLLKLIYVTMSVLGIPILSFVVCFHHPCNTGTFFLIIFCLESADRLESTWDKED
ncbi:Protein of unknown function [Gryllus bimaculatus]|nr:Protein of unknown function [Gryllus bimaculatus]